MGTLYAHRLFHGEGCGHSVELSLDDYTTEKDTTVHPVTEEMLEAFVQDYIKTNTHDGDLIADFVDTERMKQFLGSCMTTARHRLTEQEKSFITDAELSFEEQIDALEQVREAA